MNEHYVAIGALVTVIGVLFKILIKQYKESNETTKEVTKAIVNNTNALIEIKSMHKDSTEQILAAMPAKKK